MQANQRAEFRKFENLDLALETETEAGIHTHHNISINCLASSQPARLSFTTIPYIALSQVLALTRAITVPSNQIVV